MSEEKKITIGGQAVIEGVMMRGPEKVATAVRTPEGKIEIECKPVNSISDRYPILKKPMLRGCVSLGESMVMGIKSLSFSAKMAGEEDEQMSDKEIAGTVVFAFILAAVLFVAIPTGAAKLFHTITEDPFFLNIMEGILRLCIFLAYICITNPFAISFTLYEVDNLLSICFSSSSILHIVSANFFSSSINISLSISTSPNFSFFNLL